MAYSQNGFSAKNAALIATYTIPGSSVRVSLRKGDCSVVLLYVAEQFHKTVEALRQSDTGGYNPRSIVGASGSSISNHASGTAIDVRWRDHPLGARGTFSSKQVSAIRRILKYCEGVIRWGGDYKSRKDEMHFEIVGTMAQVTKLANKIRGKVKTVVKAVVSTVAKAKAPKYPGKPLKRGMMNNAAVRVAQGRLKTRGWTISVDGDFGPATERVVRQFQDEKKLKVDGIIGPKTWSALWSAKITK